MPAEPHPTPALWPESRRRALRGGRAAALTIAGGLLAAACGSGPSPPPAGVRSPGIDAARAGGQSGAAVGTTSEDVLVSAAASLRGAFVSLGAGRAGGRLRLSFGGSDALAATIRQGVRPDVLAAADAAIPADLHADGLVGRPVVFATNRLVLAVPASGSPVSGLADLGRPGVTIAVGADGVPIGALTRSALARLPPAARKAIGANVRSREPDVTGVVGKLSQGAVDAGFVYRTDVLASGGRLRAVPLPAGFAPRTRLAAAAVVGAPHPDAAGSFVRSLTGARAQRVLAAAGFGSP